MGQGFDAALVRGLRNGDEVTWNDPDEGACTRTMTIRKIVLRGRGGGAMVEITDTDGGYLECLARELS